MPTSVDKVTGIGPQTAILLANHGINSAEDLAARRVGDLAAIKGFSVVRAGQVIEAARQLIGTVVTDNPDFVVTSAKKEKTKKNKDKKKKDQTKKTPKNNKKSSSKGKKKSSDKDGGDKNKGKKSKKKSSKKK